VQPEALEHCPWLCSAPDGPNTPFDWPVYFVVDTLRLGITVVAVALIVISIWAITRSRAAGQKVRFLAVVPLLVSVLGTELEHLGDVPHWRFLTGLTGVLLLSWGYYQHLFREVPARDRTTQNGE
jgi:hypothetical protein